MSVLCTGAPAPTHLELRTQNFWYQLSTLWTGFLGGYLAVSNKLRTAVSYNNHSYIYIYWVFDFLMIVGINFDSRPDTLWGFGAISKTCLTLLIL
jgi:hypothetical protein